MSRFFKGILTTGSIVVLFLTAGLLALWFGLIDISKPVRAIVIRQLEKVTARDVSLGDDLEFALTLTPTLIATDFSISNMPSGSDGNMIEVETLSIQLQLIPLLRREIVIDSLALSGGTVILERNPEGRPNWQFDVAPDARKQESDHRRMPLFLAETSLTDMKLIWIEQAAGRREQIALEALSWNAAGPIDPLVLQGRARWKQKPIDISGQLGAIEKLLSGSGRWPVHLRGRIDTTTVEIEGEIGLDGEMSDLAVDLEGESTHALGDLFGISIPSVGEFKMSGAIRGPIAAPRLEAVSGTAGSIKTAKLHISNGSVSNLSTFADFQFPLSLEMASSAQIAEFWDSAVPLIGNLSAAGILRRTSSGQIEISSLNVVGGERTRRLAIMGNIGEVFSMPRLDLKLEGVFERFPEGDGSAYASLTPVSGQARLTGPIDRLKVRDMAANLAGISIHGQLEIEPMASPPKFTGSLSTGELDLEVLAGLQPPSETIERSTDTEDGNFNLSVLRAVTLDLDLKVKHFFSNQLSAGPANATLKLKDGDLTLQDIDISVLGGKVENTRISIDSKRARGRNPPRAAMSLRLKAEDLDLGALLKRAGTVPASNLEIDVDLTAESAGKTPTELISELEGSGHVISDGGRILETKLDQLVQDLDPVRMLLPFWKRADVVNVNCLVADIDLDEGIGNTDVMLDTGKMTVFGKGKVDLRKEHLDFTLNPRPKSKALSATGVPVEVTGDLTSPEVTARPRDAVPPLFKGLVGGLLVPLNQVARIFGGEARDACARALQ